jgi:hypothetical protein
MSIVEFLMIWALFATALGATVGLLWLIFELKDACFGFESLQKEAIIATVLSLLMALVIAGLMAVVAAAEGDYPTRTGGIAGLLILTLGYRVTHLEQFEWFEAGLIAVVYHAVLGCLLLALGAVLT